MSRWGLVAEYGGFWLEAAAYCVRTPVYRTVVVANPPDFLVFATLAQRLRGARVVLDIHDLMSDLFLVRLDKPIDSPEMRLVTWLERASFRYADRLMTVHEPYAREVSRRVAGSRSVAVVMNSADSRLFRPRDSTPEGPPVVCYHGSIFERYGVFDVLQAFARISARFRDAQLWMLGGGDARRAVEVEARSLGISARCRFSDGFIPAEEIAGLLPKVHVGVIPNRPNLLNRYALSTKLFEYVAVGVPVVCVRLETLSAHFSEDELLFYEPQSVVDLAEKLGHALDNPQEMAERARRAGERCARSYSWEHNSKVFLREIDA
jgi:glycosyltransferase involved in cell wall biosynthesis